MDGAQICDIAHHPSTHVSHSEWYNLIVRYSLVVIQLVTSVFILYLNILSYFIIFIIGGLHELRRVNIR